MLTISFFIIVLCYLPGIDFVPAFMGCLYAGMIAVPAYPLRNNHHAQRLITILNDCQPKVILGTQESLLLMQAQPDFVACQYGYSEGIFDELADEYRPEGNFTAIHCSKRPTPSIPTVVSRTPPD